MQQIDLRGINPAIDHASLKRYIEWLVPQGRAPLLGIGDAGRGTIDGALKQAAMSQ